MIAALMIAIIMKYNDLTWQATGIRLGIGEASQKWRNIIGWRIIT